MYLLYKFREIWGVLQILTVIDAMHNEFSVNLLKHQIL